MSRKYDASRRVELARKTREDILEAAFRLHGQGILDTESLAKEANVSVATVRKHFPTRELLFEGCTAFGMHFVHMPDFEALAAIEDPVDRTREAVRQVHATQEALLGQVWTALKHEDESPSLAATLQSLDGAFATAVDLIVEGWPGGADGDTVFRGFVRGMLSPLTYRALRVQAGLPRHDATSQVAEALVRAGQSAAEPEKRRAAYR